MKLSIITINYNNCEGLKKTIESVLCQTWHDFEWVIIDGGSTDGSRDMISDIGSSLAYWCSEPDDGIYNALNKGVAHCHGEYICCLNSGDAFYDKNVLKTVFASCYEVDVLYGDALFVFPEHEEIKTYPKTITLSWLYHDTINHQASFVKRELMERFSFDESYKIMADRKLWLQIILSGGTFRHLPMLLVRYDHTGISALDGEQWLSELRKVQQDGVPGFLQNRWMRRLCSIFMYLKQNLRDRISSIIYSK